MSVTAGFCEELIYRGFSIRMLQGRNMRTLAVCRSCDADIFLYARARSRHRQLGDYSIFVPHHLHERPAL